jgi:hypothetical protein
VRPSHVAFCYSTFVVPPFRTFCVKEIAVVFPSLHFHFGISHHVRDLRKECFPFFFIFFVRSLPVSGTLPKLCYSLILHFLILVFLWLIGAICPRASELGPYVLALELPQFPAVVNSHSFAVSLWSSVHVGVN